MIAGVLEGQTYVAKLDTLEYHDSLIAPGDPLAEQYMECLNTVEREHQRIAEEEGMCGGDLQLSLGLDGAQDEPTVQQLKALVEERRSIPMARPRLIYAGSELDNSRTIGLYNIADGAIIFLVRRRPTRAHLTISVHVTQTGKT